MGDQSQRKLGKSLIKKIEDLAFDMNKKVIASKNIDSEFRNYLDLVFDGFHNNRFQDIQYGKYTNNDLVIGILAGTQIDNAMEIMIAFMVFFKDWLANNSEISFGSIRLEWS
jgi:hypothetical protein